MVTITKLRSSSNENYDEDRMNSADTTTSSENYDSDDDDDDDDAIHTSITSKCHRGKAERMNHMKRLEEMNHINTSDDDDDDDDENGNDDSIDQSSRTDDEDSTSRGSEFDTDTDSDNDDNDDDNHSDNQVVSHTNNNNNNHHKNQTRHEGQEQQQHLPLGERLRHLQMERGIHDTYKEQRKRRASGSSSTSPSQPQPQPQQKQGHIDTIKEQLLLPTTKKNTTETNKIKQGHGNGMTTTTTTTNTKTTTKTTKSKHAPTVMSSKRSDFYHRQWIDNHSGGVAAIGTNIQAHANVYKGRDPRNNNNSSSTTSAVMNKQRGGKALVETLKHTTTDEYQHGDYAFLQEMRNTEIQTLQKRIQARQLTGRRGQEHRRKHNISYDDDDGLVHDQNELHRLQQERANYERRRLDIETKRVVQQTIRQGKRPRENESDNNIGSDGTQQQQAPSSKYVPKVRELKRMYMETKYDLLSQQQRGKNTIDKMILKKHIKNKSKDSKKHM